MSKEQRWQRQVPAQCKENIQVSVTGGGLGKVFWNPISEDFDYQSKDMVS